jgi:hypothetical protein
MMQRFAISVGSLVSLLLFTGCHHANRPEAANPVSHAPYVRAADFDYKALLPEPPADGSPAHVAEIERMLQLQQARTPAEVARCQSEEEVTVMNFADVLGPWFNAKNLPMTEVFMREVYDEAKDASGEAKKIWKRTRPPLYDQRIHPCVKLEKSFSYPSGHATRGIVWAVLLAEIFPDQREALMAKGREIGTDRTLAGMHYPSDVQAGQALGAEVAKRMLANPQFRADFERIKQEVLAAAAGQARRAA